MVHNRGDQFERFLYYFITDSEKLNMKKKQIRGSGKNGDKERHTNHFPVREVLAYLGLVIG